jgi:ribose 5-phosphate isomerase RpiB
MCLGSRIVGEEVARELVRSFVNAKYEQNERFQRRLNKINQLEVRSRE